MASKRAEKIWMEFGMHLGWSLDKCEFLAEAYKDEMDRDMRKELEDYGSEDESTTEGEELEEGGNK